MRVSSSGGSGPTRPTLLGSTSTFWWTSSSARPTARTRPGKFWVWISPTWVWGENTWSTGLRIRLDFRSYLSFFVSLCLFFFMCICLYMSFCLIVSLSLFVSLSLWLSISLTLYLSVSLSLCLSVSLSLWLSLVLSLWLYVYVSLCLFFCLSVFLYFCFYVSLPGSLFICILCLCILCVSFSLYLFLFLIYFKDVQNYYQYMVDTVILLGADRQAATDEMKDSLIFEIKLANISAPREERRNVTNLYNPTTVKQIDGYPG